jgi:hypothetical protein
MFITVRLESDVNTFVTIDSGKTKIQYESIDSSTFTNVDTDEKVDQDGQDSLDYYVSLVVHRLASKFKMDYVDSVVEATIKVNLGSDEDEEITRLSSQPLDDEDGELIQLIGELAI